MICIEPVGSLVAVSLNHEKVRNNEMKLIKNVSAVLLLIFLVLSIQNMESVSAKTFKTVDGKKCTIVGTKNKDILIGSKKNDVICGLGGNDTIKGLGGADTIDGGTGNDTILAGSGNDVIYGGTGNDTIDGESGSDMMVGGSGKDTVTYAKRKATVRVDLDGKKDDGEKGEKDLVKSDIENIVGGVGNDSLTGNDHSNVIEGGKGNDTIKGGKGNDEIKGNDGDDKLIGDKGEDKLNGGLGSNTCYLDENDETSVSCQLLKDLGDLVVRVKGNISNSDLNGCYFFLNSIVGEEPAASGRIDEKGNFEFDAFTGKYYNWQVGKLYESGYTDYPGENPSCKSNIVLSGNMYSLDINHSTPKFSMKLPDLIDTTISVRNSSGKRLSGLKTSHFTGGQVITPTSWDENSYYTIMIPPFTTQTDKDYKVKVLKDQSYDIYLSGKIYGMKISRRFQGEWSKEVNLVVK